MTAELNPEEKDALRAVSEALVTIRLLARKPLGDEARRIIFDLADAFHNIPAHVAGNCAEREANVFLLRAGLKHAQEAYKRYRVLSSALSDKLPPL